MIKKCRQVFAFMSPAHKEMNLKCHIWWHVCQIAHVQMLKTELRHWSVSVEMHVMAIMELFCICVWVLQGLFEWLCVSRSLRVLIRHLYLDAIQKKKTPLYLPSLCSKPIWLFLLWTTKGDVLTIKNHTTNKLMVMYTLKLKDKKYHKNTIKCIIQVWCTSMTLASEARLLLVLLTKNKTIKNIWRVN